MRRLSAFLLTIEAIVLVFPTVFGAVFLIGGSGLVWAGVWNGGALLDALVWVALLLALVAAWWLLLAYFYAGPEGASRVPLLIWIFAGLVALLAVLAVTVEGENSGLEVGIIFVPTFLHLVGEVWVWRACTSSERAHER